MRVKILWKIEIIWWKNNIAKYQKNFFCKNIKIWFGYMLYLPCIFWQKNMNSEFGIRTNDEYQHLRYGKQISAQNICTNTELSVYSLDLYLRPIRGWPRPLRGWPRPLRATPSSSGPASKRPGPASESPVEYRGNLYIHILRVNKNGAISLVALYNI